jgi:hypothetical protein
VDHVIVRRTRLGRTRRRRTKGFYSYNSKHTHLLACISLKPPVHLMERVRSNPAFTCQGRQASKRFSAVLCSQLLSCRMCCLRVYCLVRKTPCCLSFPVSSVLFLHSISLIHRHLALYPSHSRTSWSKSEVTNSRVSRIPMRYDEDCSIEILDILMTRFRSPSNLAYAQSLSAFNPT